MGSSKRAARAVVSGDWRGGLQQERECVLRHRGGSIETQGVCYSVSEREYSIMVLATFEIFEIIFYL